MRDVSRVGPRPNGRALDGCVRRHDSFVSDGHGGDGGVRRRRRIRKSPASDIGRIRQGCRVRSKGQNCGPARTPPRRSQRISVDAGHLRRRSIARRSRSPHPAASRRPLIAPRSSSPHVRRFAAAPHRSPKQQPSPPPLRGGPPSVLEAATLTPAASRRPLSHGVGEGQEQRQEMSEAPRRAYEGTGSRLSSSGKWPSSPRS